MGLETRTRARRAVLTGAGATVVCALPLYLTGALAVQLTEELTFGLAQLGVAVAIFRGIGALTASFMGALADRIGAKLSLRVAVTGACLSSLGVAAFSTTYVTFVAWLVLGAAGKSLCQPAANRLLVNNVQSHKRGLAFGIKQSAAPASTMIGGLSVPLIALTVGWRWAYVMVAAMGLAVILLVGKRQQSPGTWRKPKVKPAPLQDPITILTLALAFGLGTLASSAVPIFYVDAAVRGGTAINLAGTLLAVASIGSMLTRIGTGILADRLGGGHVLLCSGLLLAGAAGIGLFTVGRPLPMAVGLFIALAGTWGFNGVFWYALMRAYPEAPGKVTGFVAPGGLIGGVLGPIIVGWVAENISYTTGWTIAAISAVLGATGMLYGARRLARHSEERAA